MTTGLDVWSNMNRDAFRTMPVVGVEDGAFQKGTTLKALLAVVLLKRLKIESVKTARITFDGLDATERLAKILGDWAFKIVMLAGVSFAGFNVIAPTAIYEEFVKPIIVVSKTKPNNEAVRQALEHHFEDWRTRWGVFEKLGAMHRVVVFAGRPPVYVETVGLRIEWASGLIRALSVCRQNSGTNPRCTINCAWAILIERNNCNIQCL